MDKQEIKRKLDWYEGFYGFNFQYEVISGDEVVFCLNLDEMIEDWGMLICYDVIKFLEEYSKSEN